MSTIAEILNRTKTEPVHRSLSLTREAINEDTRTVEICFSTEEPILHWFGYLILDHSPDSADLTRMNSGGPLLYAHDRNKKIGVNENARIENDRKGRATVRFSKTGLGAEKFIDVVDGIERTVSFGFRIFDLTPEVGNDGNRVEIDGEPVYRSKKWEPFEFTIEPIAADLGAGIGRNLEQNSEKTPLVREENKMPKELENNTPVEPTAPQVTITRSEADKAKDFIDYGELFKQGDLARDYYAAGKTMTELNTEISRRRAEQAKIPQKPAVELNERELGNYSISRALSAMADKDNCEELEISKELSRKAGQNSGRLLLPISFEFARKFAPQSLVRAGLDTKTAGKGDELVFTQPGSFIDLLRNRAKVLMLGAQVYSGLTGGKIEFPRQIGAIDPSLVAENPGSDVGNTDLTLDSVMLDPKTIQATTKYSRQLLRQNLYSVDQRVMEDFIQTHALKADFQFLHGDGTGNNIKGLYLQNGVNPVAFGGGITFAKIVEMETAIADVNGDVGAMAYLTTSKVRGAAKTTQKLSNTAGVSLWENNEMNGYRAEATNQLSKVMSGSAATGGTGNGLLFGVWSEYMVGEWGTLEIIVDEVTLAGSGMVKVISFQMLDGVPRHGECFAKGTGLTA
jgi:HK97 family phage major capsid protein